MSEVHTKIAQEKAQNQLENRYIRLIILFLLTMILLYLFDSPGIGLTQSEDDLDFRVDQIIEAMSLEEKIGQLFMVYWSGTNVLTPSLKELISEYKVGSVYISGANFVNSEQPTAAEQIASLTNQLQTYNWEHNTIIVSSGEELFLPLFLSVDHEGDGPRYTRIRTGMTPIPSQLSIGASWSTENAESVGYIVGTELSAIGINMLLGPVLDVVDNPSVSAEGNLDVRVFGGDPTWVGELSAAYIRGVHLGSEGTVVTVAKHFPGHGDSDRATDQRVAVTNKSLTELVEIDLVPFLKVAQFDDEGNLGVTDAIMSSHIAIAATGKEPVSLYIDANDQRGGLVKLLEDVDGFNDWYVDGFIVSDSLGVGAIKNEYGENFPHVAVATDAFLAGNDLLILHNFVPSIVHYSDPNAHDLDAHGRIKEVILHFQTRYQNDDRFKERVDNALRKIVRAKLQLYPELTIDSVDSVLVNEEEVVNEVGTEENYETIINIAEDAVALLKPESVINLPSRPERDDNIVLIVHNFDLFPCEICGDEWLQQVQNNFPEFFIDDRRFIRQNIYTYYFYRKDPNETAGISTFLYGWYLGVDHTLSPITDDEVREIRAKLWNADWIIFIFAAGDCGPEAYQTGPTRCQRGRAEADTLHWFLQYAQDDNLEAKIVALAFGAPPWTLDTTDAGLLDAYYGVFSQLEVFQQSAAHAFLREFTPTGASPIDVSATGYSLEETLKPSPSQVIELQLLNKPLDSEWFVGDSVSLSITGVVDNNGNPLLDRTPVKWSGIYDSGARLTVDEASSEYIDRGQSHASFNLTREGQVTFSARIGEVESERLTIMIQERPIPTGVPVTSMPTLEGNMEIAIPTVLPESLETPVEGSLEEVVPEITPEVKTELPENKVSIILALLALIIGALIILFRFPVFFGGILRYLLMVTKRDFTILEDPRAIVTLIKKLDQFFNDEELRHLCLELGVDYDNLGGSGKKDKARELVTYLNRRGKIAKLLTVVEKLRPNTSWR